MELTVSRKDLLNSLGSVSGAIKKNVLVEVSEKLNISTTDEIISIMSSCGADIKKEGSVCVEYSRLLGFAKNYQGESIKLKATKAGWLNIEGENIKLRLPGAKDEKPVVEFKSLDNIVKIDYNEMKNAINMTEFAVGVNKAREGLMGLNMDISSNSVVLSGADERIMARYISEVKNDFTSTVLIPKKSASEIGKIVDSDSVISLSENIIQIESGSLKFKSSLLQAGFPNLNGLIDISAKNKIKVSKDPLTNLINVLLSVSTGRESLSVFKFVFGGGKIQIISQKLDTGDGDGVIDCDYTGPDIEVGVNIEFLRKAMAVINDIEDDHVFFNIKDSGSPIVLTSDSMPNYKSMIMPVRILW